MTTTLPKVELHCHIEGAARPDLVRRVAARHGVNLTGLFDERGNYVWHDFTSFIRAYDIASSVFRTPEDFRDLAFDHFTAIAAEGAIYGEVFISADHALASGLPYADYVAGLAAGIEDAEAAKGIVGRMVATGVRHLGPDRVFAAAKTAVAEPHPLVTGFGVAGDERMHHPRDFIEAFRIAGEAGLGLTAHAGELCGPESVIAALDNLDISRIGHGVRAIEDAALVERLVDEGIVLELCPGSNVALGLYPNLDVHPFRTLMESGVAVTVSSDDPPYFGSSIRAEYDWLNRHQGLGDEDLLKIGRTALGAAFVDDATRQRLLVRLDA
ncbi:adenosine deaminase [Kaistia algarum]|uniref:adenosine deaminase n=1 Tax=Kaistia algarum TaxID=2083279 RepID=UPI000CE938EF|nr:adenosine deaminase [Kaistia algarum]MCX5516529.1 adenosine deaminase [Kaistia algarum]PPE78357.1 adenosine deaminase [Kaistia algarum]